MAVALLASGGVAVAFGTRTRLSDRYYDHADNRPALGVTVVRDGSTEAGHLGDAVEEGSELRTAAAEVALQFASGTRLTLGPGTRLRVVDQSGTKRFTLDEGSVLVVVRHLDPGQRFVVATPDSEVEVGSSIIRLNIVEPVPGCSSNGVTRLDVQMGVANVTAQGIDARVSAGERWPRCQESGGAQPVVFARDAAAPMTTSVAFATPTPRSTTLAEDNGMFEAALHALHAGNEGGAVASLDSLLEAHPRSALGESALALRGRILARRAARAAQPITANREALLQP